MGTPQPTNQMDETIAQRVARLSAAIQRRSLPAVPVSTTPRSTVALNWKTLSDPVLQKMASATGDYVRALRARESPHWLTFWGTSGTGKTHLARQISSLFPTHSRWVDWTKLCRRYQNREEGVAGRIEQAIEAKLLILDDIGAEHMTPATVGLLHTLLQARLGRWTVITTNHSPDHWQIVDARISSRLIRGKNRHVCCETLDYATR